MKYAQSINEVITQLDDVIDWSKTHQSRIGYFASLYKLMTVAVQQGIINKKFDDGPRMEQLDVIFANRYLDAFYSYSNNKPCTNAWCKAFESCQTNNLVVLQHLILGINTHINLDLAIAAAQTCPGEKIYDLQNDFEKINGVIADTSQKVQNSLSNIWFPLRFLQKIANKREEAVLNFSITASRKASWANAVALALVQGTAHSNYINLMDAKVVDIGNRIMKPGIAMSFILKPVLLMETKSVKSIIDILNA